MKLLQFASLSLFSLLLLIEGCIINQNPKEVLPAATQTGANTFGFLLNGQVWLPKGNDGYPNLTKYYDPSFNGKPIFNTTSYRVVSNSETQNFAMGINGIYQAGTYLVEAKGSAIASFSNLKCNYFWNDTTLFQKGTITITKLALPIVSGTFEITMYKKGCDTIKITQGRLDFKLQ